MSMSGRRGRSRCVLEVDGAANASNPGQREAHGKPAAVAAAVGAIKRCGRRRERTTLGMEAKQLGVCFRVWCGVGGRESRVVTAESHRGWLPVLAMNSVSKQCGKGRTRWPTSSQKIKCK